MVRVQACLASQKAQGKAGVFPGFEMKPEIHKFRSRQAGRPAKTKRSDQRLVAQQLIEGLRRRVLVRQISHRDQLGRVTTRRCRR